MFAEQVLKAESNYDEFLEERDRIREMPSYKLIRIKTQVYSEQYKRRIL